MILAESIAVGLLLGFILFEWIGLSAGGLVVPGYLALYWDRPVMIASTLAIALLTFAIVRLTAQITILYGRRRFLLMIITGYALRWLFELLVIHFNVFYVEVDVIGYIIPGLIANEMERQHIIPTLALLVTISIMVRLILIALGRIQWGLI